MPCRNLISDEPGSPAGDQGSGLGGQETAECWESVIVVQDQLSYSFSAAMAVVFHNLLFQLWRVHWDVMTYYFSSVGLRLNELFLQDRS